MLRGATFGILALNTDEDVRGVLIHILTLLLITAVLNCFILKLCLTRFVFNFLGQYGIGSLNCNV